MPILPSSSLNTCYLQGALLAFLFAINAALPRYLISYFLVCRELFGGQATEAKVLAELQGYSDFEIHSLALANGKAFAKFVLEEKHLYSSAKCCLLAKLLPELQVPFALTPALQNRLPLVSPLGAASCRSASCLLEKMLSIVKE